MQRLLEDRQHDPISFELLSLLVGVHDALGVFMLEPLPGLVWEGQTRSPSAFLQMIEEMKAHGKHQKKQED